MLSKDWDLTQLVKGLIINYTFREKSSKASRVPHCPSQYVYSNYPNGLFRITFGT